MDKKTKRLGNGATKRDLIDAHRIKMEMKKILNDHNSKTYATREHIFANLSKNHPHYGDTPRENADRKLGIKPDNDLE